MTRMTGGEAVVQSLLSHGLDTLFGLPGVQNDWLYNALYDAGGRVRVIHTRHEQGAAYMALGASLVRGDIAVCSVVPGPGVLNAAAALATAYALNAQLLFLCGQIPLRDARLILPTGSRAHRMLSEAVQNCKAVVFAGLPGVGKTLLLQQMALLSHAAGRPLHLLQWDIARQGFETPEILARYPEVEGTTHAAIRRAAGFWVRGAVANWAAAHACDDALLLGEAPFVGNRLIELARREADAAESFLAARSTLFIIPAPTLAVRRAIETTREREIEQPRHARALAIDECWPVVASPYELDMEATELHPSPAEVAGALARVEALGAVELERAVRQWYLPAGH